MHLLKALMLIIGIAAGLSPVHAASRPAPYPQSLSGGTQIWKSVQSRYQSRLEALPKAQQGRISRKIFALSSSALGLGFLGALIFGSDESTLYEPTLAIIGLGIMALGLVGFVVGAVVFLGEGTVNMFKRKPKAEVPVDSPEEMP